MNYVGDARLQSCGVASKGFLPDSTANEATGANEL